MANHRHTRDANARKKPRATIVAAPLAVLATASAVTLGIVASNPHVGDDLARTAAQDLGALATSGASVATDRRLDTVSRDFNPATKIEKLSKAEQILAVDATNKAVKKAETRLWTTEDVNIWNEPGEKAEKLGEIEFGKQVLVTGRELFGREEIVRDGKARWITAGYLSKEEPPDGPTLGGECTNGTSVESGVAAGIAAVHEAVCANFPSITVYGTLRGGGGDHGSGHAVDIMVSGDMGRQVAEFVKANASAFNLNYVIYEQAIFSVERGGEGWRGMENRGSTTANHFDHVHVSVY